MYEWTVFISEIVLAAYPILIKLTDASVFTQVGFRTFTFAIAAAVAAFVTGTSLVSTSYRAALIAGISNLLHVGASYAAFSLLPAGIAMSIFYIYPILNLLGSSVVFDEKITGSQWFWMLIGLLGAVAISKPATSTGISLIGIICAIIAAITETGTYLWFRELEPHDKPWQRMFEMYGTSGILWAIIAAIAAMVGRPLMQGTLSSRATWTMILFNILIGFVGYGARFFAIPKVSTVAFSSISFFGIVSAYIFGWLFEGEKPTLLAAAGSAAIITANSFILNATR